MVLVIWRRHMQPIKARSFLLVLLTLFAQYTAIITTAIRLGVGRWRYPCVLYTIFFALVAPTFFLPSIFRMWRILFLFRNSHWKRKMMLQKKKKQQQQRKMKQRRGNKTGKSNQALTTPSSPATPSSPSSPSSLDIEMNELQPSDTSSNTFTISDFTTARNNRWFNLQKLFVSNKFIVLSLIAIAIGQFFVWIICILIPYHTGEQLRELLSFRLTCRTSKAWMVVIGVQLLFFFIVQLVLLALLYILRVNDKWNVRLEVTVSWFITTITFGFSLFLLVFNDFFYLSADRHFPTVLYGLYGLVIDLVWTVVWPLIQTFFKNNNKQESNESDESLLQDVLNDNALREVYKRFCASSLVVEPVCFYEDNCVFSNGTRTDNKRLVEEAKYMLNKYCTDMSPLQLNLPSREKLLAPIKEKLEQYEQQLKQMESEQQTATNSERWVDPQLFHAIHLVCMNDMNTDTFVRFKVSKEYTRFLTEKKALEKKQETYGV